MSDSDVRIGINPISWTNDDLPALGGETPLETALDRRQGDRLRRIRARQQVSARARGAARGARAPRPRVRVGLVFGPPRARDASPTRSPRSTAHLDAARGERRAGDGLRRSRRLDPGPPRGALAATALRDGCRVARVRRAGDGVCAAHARPRRAPRVPSSHGRVCRDGRGRRPSDAASPAPKSGCCTTPVT